MQRPSHSDGKTRDLEEHLSPERPTQWINTTVRASLKAFRRYNCTFGDFPLEVPFQTSTADSLVIPFWIQTLYGESAAPKLRLVLCLLSHSYVSTYMGPKLRSHTPLHLLLLVRGALSVSELRGAHTRACPGAVFRSAHRFSGQPGSISPFLSASSHESIWLEYRTYRRTSLPPTKHVHSGHGLVDLTETPRPGFLPGFLIVRHSLVVLIKDVIFVELEKGLDLCHHPSQRNIGFALIRISSTNILMYAREPILDTVSVW